MGVRRTTRQLYRVLNHKWESKHSPLHIADPLETLEHLSTSACSLVRYGDYEIKLMLGKDVGYQKYNPQLIERLVSVASSMPGEQLQIGIPFMLLSLSGLTKRAVINHSRLVYTYRKAWYKFFRSDCTYMDAESTRPYIDRTDHEMSKLIFDKWKTIWRDRNVVIISGSSTLFGVGNDLLQGCSNIKRILAPARNAFVCNQEIVSHVRENVPDGTLCLVALGPAAVPLVQDLSRLGFRALDVGHLDIEYEWYLRRAKERINIPGKYVNEAVSKVQLRGSLDSVEYRQQIIADFSV